MSHVLISKVLLKLTWHSMHLTSDQMNFLNFYEAKKRYCSSLFKYFYLSVYLLLIEKYLHSYCITLECNIHSVRNTNNTKTITN